MRTGVIGLATATVVLAVCTTSLAAERHPGPRQSTGVSSVTDANGRPLPLHAIPADTASPTEKHRGSPLVQRGQTWWPYASAMPPYTSVMKRAEAMTEDEIQINGVALLNVRDVESTLRLVPKELRVAESDQLARPEGFYLVKIAGFSRTQEQIDALTGTGAVLGEYLNINTYIAKIPSASLSAVRSLPFVKFVGDYQPAFKISPRIGLEAIPVEEAIDAATGEPKPWLFEITLHKGVYVEEVLNDMARIGVFPQDGDIISNEEMTVVRVRTSPDAVPALSQIPGVKWIAEKAYPRLLASAANPAAIPMILQNNGAYTTSTATGWKLWNAGIDGSATNQIVTMMDSGLDTLLYHFSQDTVTEGNPGPSHRKVVAYEAWGSGDLCVLDDTSQDGGHGAKTSQHAVGSISNMTSNPDTVHVPNGNWDDGIAKGGKVYFQDIGTSASTINPPGDLGPSIVAAMAKNSFIQNHSWGAPNNMYDAEAQFLDTALFNHPEVVVTASAGNAGIGGTGTLDSPSTAKNAISVGGNDASNPNSLFADCTWDGSGSSSCNAGTDLGSSRGPVTGLSRKKPDIMTFMWANTTVGGEQMAAAQPDPMCQTDPPGTPHFSYLNLGNEGGTSFAAPEAAGLAALVRDYFMQGFYPTGSPVAGNALTPKGSLVKAVLLASGEVMNTTASPTTTFAIASRYSSDVGYGRANLPGVLHIGGSAPFLWVQNHDVLGPSATKTFTYTINGNGMPLRVMMVYYDQMGDALVKDADLKVTIGANVYWGNSMTGGWSNTALVRDRTNNTEGVFLDAAHGLPASGTVQVDVIGFNDPGGMNYSLVVSGNVVSTNTPQVFFENGIYDCSDTANITVNDATATSPVSVTVVSKNASSTTIDTRVISCTGTGGAFHGSIVTGSGINVVNGGTITATYSAVTSTPATINCRPNVTDDGFIIGGGCDNAAAGTNPVTGPLFNGGSNEFYTKYMDGGEYSSYKMAFINNTGAALTDVTLSLSFSGAGASKMTALNGPFHIGAVAAGAAAGGVFQLFTDASVTGLTPVNLDFDIISPADGYTTPTRLTQTRVLQANDKVARQNRCSTFTGSLTPWVESSIQGLATNPWRWSGAATTPSVVASENRTDGICSNGTANNAAMVGNSAIASGFNFSAGAGSALLQNFQPAQMGNNANGQPYNYTWKWHSFYHASETFGATTGVWGVFYNNHWDNPVNPTGTDVDGFSIFLPGKYFLQTDYFDYVGTWNWETANTGTPDDPTAVTRAPNQVIINFTGISGPATNATYFAYGHEHFDYALFTGGSSTALTRRDIALDNDNFVYDEYYAEAQVGSCAPGTQLGQVSFDQVFYETCPSGPMVMSVVDANGVSGMHVTVTSPGTSDSEIVTLTGSPPYFTGTLNMSTASGVGNNNGTLFVMPNETISASYTDTSPAGSTTATAITQCPSGDVIFFGNAQVADNGDNDTIPDNNECVTLDISIKNNLAAALTNTKVTIFSTNANVDLIPDDHAYYGTVAPGATATNPPGDRFTFHVNPAVACVDPNNPQKASFIVAITADGFSGPALLQTFQINLDLDITGTFTYTQNFTVNPNWTTGAALPDNPGCTDVTYPNDFHWCALCGNASGGYGAWVGNAAFGTGGQNYTDAFNSSTLYSPVFSANGATTMQFRAAYRTELSGFDGAIAQYSMGGGPWTTLAYSTPVQGPTTTSNFCSPILAGSTAWTGNGVTWTLTNAPTVPTTAGQSIQFRWRLGGDVSGNGATFGGFGVDDVAITNLRQFACEPTRNTGAPPCCLAPSLLVNNTAVDPNLCATTGIQISWPKDPDNWGDGGAGTRTYDVLRNGTPIVTGVAYGTTTTTDATAVAGTTYTYTVRYKNGCGGTTITTGAARADSSNVVCSASDQCHNAGVCAPATGLCSNPPKTDGTGCNDSNLCTQTDTCQSGVCVGGNPVVCTALDECHIIGTCTAGVCSNPSAPNGTGCDDGNFCTTGDVCTGGNCAGTPQAPGELQNASFTDKTTFQWDTIPNSPTYDILRGAISALPVGPGGGDEVCFDNHLTSVLTDGSTPAPGQGFWYVVRATTACGTGTYGTRHDLTPRVSTTCP